VEQNWKHHKFDGERSYTMKDGGENPFSTKNELKPKLKHFYQKMVLLFLQSRYSDQESTIISMRHIGTRETACHIDEPDPNPIKKTLQTWVN
jgi:hypothetical protein